MRKEIRKINGKDVSIEITGLKDAWSSDTKFFNVHFLDQKDSSKYTILHVGFSYQYLNFGTDTKNIDFDKVVQEDINEILDEIGYDIFNKEEHFIFYSLDGRQYGRVFSMS